MLANRENGTADPRAGRVEADCYRQGVRLLTHAPTVVGIVVDRPDIAPRMPSSALIRQACSAYQARERGGCRMLAA